MLQSASGPKIGDWELARTVSEWIEFVAIGVIAISVLVGFVAGFRIARATGVGPAIETVKQQIGRGLLLGLDLLIAADIIRTVTLEPTLDNVTALGVLVIVRTFLAWSIVVEIEGQWPWRLGPTARRGSAATDS